jgi:enolase 1/2/3
MARCSSCIAGVTARPIFDSRGRPTVEADVVLDDGARGRASVPSGTSTGRYEARELRDGDPAAHAGLGVGAATGHVRGEIAARIAGMDALDQEGVDRALIELDGSPSLARLGANAVLATSLAVARAAAAHLGQPLHRYLSRWSGGAPMTIPMPMANVVSGGAHVGRGRGLDFQDFLVIPIGATRYAEALAMIARTTAAAAGLLAGAGAGVRVASDGGLDPGFRRTEQALELLVRSFEAAGLRPGVDVAIGVDAAASELADGGAYHLVGEDRRLSSREMIDYVLDAIARFPIVSIEDPLDQDDWDGWRALARAAAAPTIQIVGDDLFATNLDRVARGIAEGAATAAIVKPNQNGTLTGTLAVIAALRAAGLGAIVAGRSGDTEDPFVADLAVGTGAGQIKIGAFRNSERLAKYNQLVRIADEEPGLALARWRSRRP